MTLACIVTYIQIQLRSSSEGRKSFLRFSILLPLSLPRNKEKGEKNEKNEFFLRKNKLKKTKKTRKK